MGGRPGSGDAAGTDAEPDRRSRLAEAVFASAGDSERRRRPVDALTLAVAVGVVFAAAARQDDPTELGENLTRFLVDLPDWITTLLGGVFAVTALYGLTLVFLAVVAGDRRGLVRDLLVAAVGALGLAVLIARAVEGDWPELGLSAEPARSFPVLHYAGVTAVAVTAGPHLIRPVRQLGAGLVLVSAAAVVALQLGSTGDAVAGFALGVGTAAAVHLGFGSPGGGPSLVRIRAALRTMGIEPVDLTPAADTTRGALRLWCRDTEDRNLVVKVIGRDASDTQFLAKAWRTIWYRDSGPTLSLTRIQQVEHEALFGLLAQRCGCTTGDLVAAASTERGDALLVLQPPDWPLTEPEHLTEGQLQALWSELRHLRAEHIAHGRIDHEHLAEAPDGTVLWADWSAASFAPLPERLDGDAAALLVLGALSVGTERSVALATEALGADGLARVSPLVQRAALSSALARAVRHSDLDLDELRAAVAEAAGEQVQDLVQLQRVSLGQILTLALVGVAAWALISNLAEIGWDTIVDAFQSASPAWLLAALVVGQTPRVATGVSTLGSSAYPLPLGPTVTLQFAVTFINLAIPSTAARVATVIRYFQKSGATVSVATTSGAIDGFAGFLVQVLLLVLTLGLGLSTLEFDLAGIEIDIDGAKLVGLLVLLAVGAAVVIMALPRLRAQARAVVDHVRTALTEARDAVRGIASARHITMLLGGNLTAELLFATTFGLVVRAYGYDLGLADLVAVNVIVALFAGLIPVPGGIGVSEGGLTAGLIALGLPEADAFAAALSYRMVTFYLPPIWGFVAFRWLGRNDYL